MPFCNDIDLLHWEPGLLKDATFASQTLISGTGNLAGATFTISSGSFITTHVQAQQVECERTEIEVENLARRACRVGRDRDRLNNRRDHAGRRVGERADERADRDEIPRAVGCEALNSERAGEGAGRARTDHWNRNRRCLRRGGGAGGMREHRRRESERRKKSHHLTTPLHFVPSFSHE